MIENNENTVADEIIALYKKYGAEDYIGEPVSQIEHMCQAAQLAETEGYDEEVILAALFHDIGHFCQHLYPAQLMGSYGIIDHEKSGSDFLKSRGFSDKIISLVQNHVQAKRYLTFINPDYYEKLSDASKKTLIYQGGRMNAEEATIFEKDPLFDLHIRLRLWDEQAKVINKPLPLLAHYRNMIISHLNK